MIPKSFRLFGERVTQPDLLALGAFTVGTLVTILDLIGLWDRLGLKPIGTINLLLLTVLILYSIQEKWELVHQNEELQNVVQSYGTLAIVKGEEGLFSSAAERLRTGKRLNMVKIYAPVGLWRTSEAKKKWFAALSEALSSEAQTVSELRAVFGLPPTEKAFKDVVTPELKIFEGRDAALLRYIPPVDGIFQDLPGIGLVILGDEAFGFGFAVHGHHTVVDSTIFIQSKQIIEEVHLWFDQVWETAKCFQLKDARREISLEQGLKKASASYQQKAV